MEHFISSLFSIFSFDHSKCDAILQLRHIDILAYSPDKIEGWRDSVYVGFWWIAIWEALVVSWCIINWKRPDPLSQDFIARYVPLLFALFGLFGLFFQLEGMAEYVDTCKAVLR
jgi:apolipoprotein N-acyltransferase